LGTEIVAVNDTPVADYLPTVVYNEHTGTDEGQRLFQVANLLKFPAAAGDAPPAEVTIEAILTDETEPQSFTMTPGAYPLPDRLAYVAPPMPIQYRIAPGYGYLTWVGFQDPEIRMAVLEKFLGSVKTTPGVKGIILDLRGNGGGWDMLYFSMASYLFSPDDPVSMHWVDQDSYDPAVGDLVREVPRQYLLSAPQPDLYYGGPVVILVDHDCASSCEFFSQFLQTNNRATVVAQHGTKGAGAPINRVAMPYGITFQYTKGRAYFAGTDELNLEGTGVVPDIRVPTTLETVAASLQGNDPVLTEGVQALFNIAGQTFVDSLTLVPLPDDMATAFTSVYPESWNISQSGTSIVISTADQQNFINFNQFSGQVDIETVLSEAGISGFEPILLESRTANGLDWSIYGFDDSAAFAYRYALAQTDDLTYQIALATPLTTVDAVTEGLLYELIDAFVPAETN
jgi:hypothetical protein